MNSFPVRVILTSFVLPQASTSRAEISARRATWREMVLSETDRRSAISPLRISSQNTRREMKSVRIYTRPMPAKIEEILSAKD